MAEWPAPNYVDPVRYGPAVIVVHAICFPIVLFMLGVRIYTRLYICKGFGMDDYLALFTMVPIAAFAVLSIFVETYVGWDVHAWDAPPNSLTLGLKCLYTTQILFTLALVLTRLSVLWLISRLFKSGAPKLQRFTHWIMIYSIVHTTIFIITLIFQCRPFYDYWTISSVPQTNCINQQVHLLFTAICGAIADYITVFLPMHTVWKLQLPIRQRISICMLFALGFLASTASVFRIIYTWQATSEQDRTWTSNTVFIWSSIEIYFGLFCACMPPTVGFWKLYYPKLVGTVHNRSDLNTSQPSTFWGSRSRSGSKRYRPNSHELGDMYDEERGIIVERGVTIESFKHHSNAESMGFQGSCTATDPSPQSTHFTFKA
ncbi:hypothetical protein NHQ30_002719 [Ciborinia camelliae]|nr:hypothetical protein NHQ30_002719 [Ciborinia camelliae]